MSAWDSDHFTNTVTPAPVRGWNDGLQDQDSSVGITPNFAADASFLQGNQSNLAEIAGTIQKMSVHDQAALAARFNDGKVPESFLGKYYRTLDYDRTTPDQQARSLGYMPGSVEYRVYQDTARVVAQGTQEDKDKFKQAYYEKSQKGRYAIDASVLATAKDPNAFVELQEKLLGIDTIPEKYAASAINGLLGSATTMLKGGVLAVNHLGYATTELAELAGVDSVGGVKQMFADNIKYTNSINAPAIPVTSDSVLQDIAGGIGSAAGYIAGSALTGGSSLGATMLGALTAIGDVSDASKNLSIEEQRANILTYGTLYALAEKVGIQSLTRSIGLNTGRASVGNWALDRTVDAGLEMAVEGSQGALTQLASGAPLDLATAGYEGIIGGGTSLALSLAGLPRTLQLRSKQIKVAREGEVLVDAVSKAIESGADEAAVRQIAGQHVKHQFGEDDHVLVDLAELAEFGGLEELAQETGVDLKILQEGAKNGQSFDVNILDVVMADAKFRAANDIGSDNEVDVNPILDEMRETEAEVVKSSKQKRKAKAKKVEASVKKEKAKRKRAKPVEATPIVNEEVPDAEVTDAEALTRLDAEETLEVSEDSRDIAVILREGELEYSANDVAADLALMNKMKAEAGDTWTDAEETERRKLETAYGRIDEELKGLANWEGGQVETETVLEGTPQQNLSEIEVEQLVDKVALLSSINMTGMVDRSMLTEEELETIDTITPQEVLLFTNAMRDAYSEIVSPSDMQTGKVDPRLVSLNEEELAEIFDDNSIAREDKLQAALDAAAVKAEQMGTTLEEIAATVEAQLPKAKPTKSGRPRGRPKKLGATKADLKALQPRNPVGRPKYTEEERAQVDAQRSAERARRTAELKALRAQKQLEAEGAKSARTEQKAKVREEKELLREMRSRKMLAGSILRQMGLQSKALKKQKRIVDLAARQEARAAIRRTVDKGRKRSIVSAVISEANGPTLSQSKLTAALLNDFMHDAQLDEEISKLDKLAEVKRIRQEVLTATQGNEEYTASIMQLLKSFLVAQGTQEGRTIDQIASSFYVSITLNSKTIQRVVDSVTAITEKEASNRIATERKALKKLKPIEASPDFVGNDLVAQILSEQDETNSMKDAQGKVISFIWGDDANTFIRGIANQFGRDTVAAIPEMIAKATKITVKKVGGTAVRVYETPFGTLEAIQYTRETGFIPARFIPAAEVIEDTNFERPRVAAVLSKTKLLGEYYSVLRGYLNQLAEQDLLDVRQLPSYEAMVRRAVDTANGITGLAGQINGLLGEVENVTPQLLDMLNLPALSTFDIPSAISSVRKWIDNQAVRAEALKYFYTNPKLASIISDMTESTVLLAQERNGDGLLRDEWMRRMTNGDGEVDILMLTENHVVGPDITGPYARETFASNLAKALEPLGVDVKESVSRALMLAEEFAFRFNTDPRVFANVGFRFDANQKTSQYNPNEQTIVFGQDAISNEALANVAVLHEMIHNIDIMGVRASNRLGAVDLGALYSLVGEQYDRYVQGSLHSTMLPLVSGGTNAQQHDSIPAEQWANLVANELLGSNDATANYEALPTEAKEIYENDSIRRELRRLTTLFNDSSSASYIEKFGTIKPLHDLGRYVKLGPRMSQITVSGGKYNASTIPHEFFHLFMDMLRVNNPRLAGQITKIEANEENLAKQFEMYLLEGKAPSLSLRRTFNNYSEWLSQVYQDKMHGRKDVNPDLAFLFNQMFATEQQIKLAEQARGLKQDLFPTAPVRKARVANQEEKAKLTAAEKLRSKLVRNALIISGRRDAIREEAQTETNNNPLNIIADEAHARKAVDMTRVRKLSAKATDEQFLGTVKDKAELDQLIVEYNQMEGVEAVDTQIDFLRLVNKLGTKNSQINVLMERKFQQEMDAGNAALGGVDNIITEAIHNPDLTKTLEGLAKAVDNEIQARGNQAYNAAVTASVKLASEERFNSVRVDQGLSYRKYITEMRTNLNKYHRAMREKKPEDAKKFLNAATRAHYNIIHAVTLRKEMADFRSKWTTGAARRLSKVQLTHVDNLVTLLRKYGINVGISGRLDKPLGQLNLPSYGDKGFTDVLGDLAKLIPSWVVNLQTPGIEADDFVSYQQLTVGQFHQLSQSMDLIEKAGTISLRTLKQEQYADGKALLDAMKDSLDSVDSRESYESKNKIKNWYDKASVYGVLNEYIFSKADGYGDIAQRGFGPHRTLFFMAREANSAAERLFETYHRKLNPMFDQLRKTLKANFNKYKWPDVSQRTTLNTSVNKFDVESVLMIALNTGNVSNMKSLTEGLGISTADIDAIMSNLSNETGVFTAIQGIWDTLGELYGPASEVWYNIHGSIPKKIDATEVTYNGHKLRGGYFPLVTRANNGSGANFWSALYPSMEQNASFMNERTGKVGPTKLDVSVLTNHVYTATRLIATGETMDTIAKVIHDKEWSDKFRLKFGQARYNDVLQHFGMMANPQNMFNASSSFGGRMAEWFRRAAVTQALGFRFVSGLKQRMDLVNVANIMRQQNRGGGFKSFKTLMKNMWSLGIKGNIGLLAMPNLEADGRITVNGIEVNEKDLDAIQIPYLKSDYVRSRDTAVNQLMRNQLNDVIGDTKGMDIFGKRVTWHEIHNMFFSFIRLNDRAAAASAWNAQYELSKNGDGSFDISNKTEDEIEKLSIRDADSVVATFSSSALPDLSAGQRDIMLRQFSTFISAQVRRGSRMHQAVGAWKAGQISTADMAGTLLLEVYAPLILTSGMTYLAKAVFGDDDDEEETDWVKTGANLLAQPAYTIASSVPIASSMVGFAQGYSRSPLDTPANVSAAVAFNDVPKALQGLKEGNMWDALKYTAYAGGYFTNIPVRRPAGDIAKTYQALGFEEKK